MTRPDSSIPYAQRQTLTWLAIVVAIGVVLYFLAPVLMPFLLAGILGQVREQLDRRPAELPRPGHRAEDSQSLISCAPPGERDAEQNGRSDVPRWSRRPQQEPP